ncbi:hypothetical protein ASPCADRAFT_135088 [Aspergillus carbonarius ITEM 5010]|uniref:Uncharacterized protein n=1 Tax=Aspergillus carbonarius (strain ITEM 5010) TaxID=602072 RepID=A0A1R3R7T9_ASPC5|nr:hypothetical protein ASPCADRAFT_135088 [Aspergillus carbonarius ITEM 5010]
MSILIYRVCALAHRICFSKNLTTHHRHPGVLASRVVAPSAPLPTLPPDSRSTRYSASPVHFPQMSRVSSCLPHYLEAPLGARAPPSVRPCWVASLAVPGASAWTWLWRPPRLLPRWSQAPGWRVVRSAAAAGGQAWVSQPLAPRGRLRASSPAPRSPCSYTTTTPFPSLDTICTISPARIDNSLDWSLLKSYNTFAVGFFCAGVPAGGGGGGGARPELDDAFRTCCDAAAAATD